MLAGAMGRGQLGALINSVARFIHLVACQSARNTPVVEYLKNAVAALKLLKPVLDGAIESRLSLGDELDSLFENLDALVNEAREIVEKRGRTMSKLYNVLRCEPLAIKIQSTCLEIGRRLCESQQSVIPAALHASIQRCLQELESADLKGGEAAEVIQLAMRDQREHGVASPGTSSASVAEALGLSSSERLVAERIALERDKARAALSTSSRAQGDGGLLDQLIELVRAIGPSLAQRDGGRKVPPFFRCPLSSELMVDPVILASGQTFERSFIRKWLDGGLRICPVTRQPLAHADLVPNFTVKALIANWCEENAAWSERGSGERDEEDDRGSVAGKTHVSDEPYRGHSRSASASSASSALDSGRAETQGWSPVGFEERTPSSTPRSRISEDVAGAADLCAVERLVDDLRSWEEDQDRAAAAARELRLLARHSTENRVAIARCGAIGPLVALLGGAGGVGQEDAVTALLNLSIDERNKKAVAEAGAAEALVGVLRAGSAVAKENAAATLASLAAMEELRAGIGRSAGAVQALVDLLGGAATLRGSKDAAAALFALSIAHENKARIVQAGAVAHLVRLLDPEGGMADKAVALLANLSAIGEGRTAVARAGGVTPIVELVETGSDKAKENAAAVLLQLCMGSPRLCALVLQEGAVPPLIALSQLGTPRAKDKAQQILSLFRCQRQGGDTAGRWRRP
ncbi:U-box domain-containing protein 3-like isoform X2 [Wolffia australiana]